MSGALARGTDVVVVGAGAFGASVAYELARTGRRVTLLDRDPPGAHASGNNAGKLNPILGSPPRLRELALFSFRRHQELAVELTELGAEPYEKKSTDRALLGVNAAALESLQGVAATFRDQPGFESEWLDAGAVRRLEPRLAPDVLGALVVRGNQSVDARGFVRAVLAGAQRLGVEFVQGEVAGLSRDGDRVTAVELAGSSIACETVVLATGPWVSATERWLGVDLGVTPLKGEMLRLRWPGAGPRCDLTLGDLTLYARGPDEVWLGVTREEAGFDAAPSERARHFLLESAARVLPEIRSASVVEHTAALRPMSKSGLPIVRRPTELENVWIVNGGGEKGILLCAGISHALANQAWEERPSPWLAGLED